MVYCSKECQARAWKHEGVPHRAVCKKIKYIVDTTNLVPKPDAEGATPFETTCTYRNVDDGPLWDFGSHMVKLQKYMSLAPRPKGRIASLQLYCGPF